MITAIFVYRVTSTTTLLLLTLCYPWRRSDGLKLTLATCGVMVGLSMAVGLIITGSAVILFGVPRG
jgi:hypothetical protein